MTILPQRSLRGAALANTVDSHVWLEPNNAVRIAFIATLRSQQYPENKAKYMANAKSLRNKCCRFHSNIESSNKAKPYWSYHDAYQYLEQSTQFEICWSID